MVKRLTYPISNEDFGKYNRDSVHKIFGVDIGYAPRYFVQARFKGTTEWTKDDKFLYDTAAPITFLPNSYRNKIEVPKSAICYFTGAHEENPELFEVIPATLIFVDMLNETSPAINTWVAISEKNDILPVIGTKNIAETHQFKTDPKKGKFYLDFY